MGLSDLYPTPSAARAAASQGRDRGERIPEVTGQEVSDREVVSDGWAMEFES